MMQNLYAMGSPRAELGMKRAYITHGVPGHTCSLVSIGSHAWIRACSIYLRCTHWYIISHSMQSIDHFFQDVLVSSIHLLASVPRFSGRCG